MQDTGADHDGKQPPTSQSAVDLLIPHAAQGNHQPSTKPRTAAATIGARPFETATARPGDLAGACDKPSRPAQANRVFRSRRHHRPDHIINVRNTEICRATTGRKSALNRSHLPLENAPD